MVAAATAARMILNVDITRRNKLPVPDALQMEFRGQHDLDDVERGPAHVVAEYLEDSKRSNGEFVISDVAGM